MCDGRVHAASTQVDKDTKGKSYPDPQHPHCPTPLPLSRLGTLIPQPHNSYIYYLQVAPSLGSSSAARQPFLAPTHIFLHARRITPYSIHYRYMSLHSPRVFPLLSLTRLTCTLSNAALSNYREFFERLPLSLHPVLPELTNSPWRRLCR
jgi:hypothetical protein